jgi:catechol 2,3-dioxygenase-like lactoylglutathione lyase family enzyme
MRSAVVPLLTVVCVLGVGAPAIAQLNPAKDGPIVYGHHHLNVTSIEAHKKFWVDTLGGKSVKVGTGTTEIIEFPNVFVFLNQRAPTGGTKGTTVNHIGFKVPNLRVIVDKVKAAGYPIVELDGYVAFVMAPDETKVELVEDKSMSGLIRLHHIHFAAQNIPEMKAWYVRIFNAKPGKRGPFEAADLPGVNLSWSGSPTPLVPTKGRVLDHLGFEVKNLEAFCKQLESNGVTLDRPYSKNAGSLGIGVAFITDPWGTSIELTEGLDTIQ